MTEEPLFLTDAEIAARLGISPPPTLRSRWCIRAQASVPAAVRVAAPQSKMADAGRNGVLLSFYDGDGHYVL
jgi:hypothetical protein